MTSQHKDLTSQHKDLTRRNKALTSQHNYLTSDGRSVPEWQSYTYMIYKATLLQALYFFLCTSSNQKLKYFDVTY